MYADVFLAQFCRQIHGDEGRARFFGLRAAELAERLDDPDALVTSLLPFLNAASTPPEAHAERITMAETLSGRSLDGVSGNRLAAGFFWPRGKSFLTWGRRVEAEEMWQRASEAAIRSQDAGVALVPLHVEGLQRILDGRLDQVLEVGERIRARGAELGREEAGRVQAGQVTRRALLYLGRIDEALRAIPETTRTLRQRGRVLGAARPVPGPCRAPRGRSGHPQAVSGGQGHEPRG